MNKTYVLYNVNAGNGTVKESIKLLYPIIKEDVSYVDMTKITSYENFFQGLTKTNKVIICGGDGTLNRFVNDTKNVKINTPLYYFACGTGNDFYRELSPLTENGILNIDDYVVNLPKVKIDGKEFLFINGIGYGIDGYCCQEGERLRKEKNKKINYAGIAIKGMFSTYKPTSAKIIVDGKEYKFDNVWLASTMNGKYYGGGMMPTPKQERLAKDGEEKKISILVFHCKNKLKTLMIFPSLFKGEHVKKEKNVTILSGKYIDVYFNSPRPLQVDGEVVPDVIHYTATA